MIVILYFVMIYVFHASNYYQLYYMFSRLHYVVRK